MTSQPGTGPGAPAPSAGPRVFVHVGEPKTGTTFLQQVMWIHRAELQQHGVTYPGPRSGSHWRATQDLREIVQFENDPAGSFKGEWAGLVDRVRRAPRVGVISHELLAATTPEQARRGVRSLAGCEVHIVVTVRDMGSLLPAEWQETVKHRNTRRWHDWLGDVIDNEALRPDRHEFGFWQVHDTMAILRDWSVDVPPERVHVITIPPSGSGSDVLWNRFADVIGLDPAAVDVSKARSNSSLGVVEVEMIRRLNEVLPKSFPNWSYMPFVKDTLAHGPLVTRPNKSSRLVLPDDRWEWAREYAAKLITELENSGYDIVGDLDELVPHRLDAPVLDPSESTDGAMLEAALESMSVLLTRMETMRRNSRRTADDLAALKYSEPNRLKQRLIDASESHRSLERARVAYWYAANRTRRLRRALRRGGAADGGATDAPAPRP